MGPDDEIDEVEPDYIGSNKLKKSRERHDLRLNYDSDSTDEDYAEKIVEHVEDTKKGADDDDDDDMFASDDDDTKNEPTDSLTQFSTGSHAKSEVNDGPKEYDELDQVEIDNEGEIHDYYNNVENIEDYPSFRNAKLKEPKMEAFIETDEGGVEAKLPEEDEKDLPEDSWSRDFKQNDIIKAKRAQEHRQSTLATKSKPISATEELLSGLIEFLDPAETPLEALARLKPTQRNRRKKINVDEETRRKNVIDLTELCEELINEKHFPDTYDMSREELLRAYKQETGRDYKQAKKGIKRGRDEDEIDDDNHSGINYGEKIWEFKWSEDDIINGPYSSYEMSHWKEGYFTNEVLVRRIGEPHFLLLEAVVFDQV